MPDFVTLTCPNCGGRLQITPDLDRFACSYCGNEHLVKRLDGAVAIQPLTESLTGLRRATDRTASELALRRLADEVAALKAARAHAESRIDEGQQILNERQRAQREVIREAAWMVPLLIVAFLWPLPLQHSGEIGPLRSAQTQDIILWLIPPLIVAMITTGVVRHKMAKPVLRLRRERIEADIAAAQETLHSADREIAALEPESALHREIVSLREQPPVTLPSKRLRSARIGGLSRISALPGQR